MGCRKIAEHFSVRKTAVSNILKDGKNLRKNFEFFKGNFKKCCHGKYHIINETFYNWYGKCTSAKVYPDGPLLQEEAMEIKRRLDKEKFAGFTASSGWLDSWKQTYGMREKKLCGEADESSIVIEGTSTLSFFKNNEKQLKKQIFTNLHTKKQFLIY